MTEGGDYFYVTYPGGKYTLDRAYPEDRSFNYPAPEAPEERRGTFRRAVESDILIYEEPAENGKGDGINVYTVRAKAPEDMRGVRLEFYIEPAAPAAPLALPGGGLIASPGSGRVAMARQLQQALAHVQAATSLHFGPFTYQVVRGVRIHKRTPTARGYKVLAEFLGVDNDAEFIDSRTGQPVPVV